MNHRALRMLAAAGMLSLALPSLATTASAQEAEQGADEATAAGALIAYRDALVALDADAASALFVEDSSVFENGKAEGSWANYLEHHLGPELGHFEAFEFPRYEVEIREMGDLAYGEERYSYRITLEDGRVIERDGVATSLLHREGDTWKIVSHHSSSRAPRN
ncbi:MAG: hypothetical protein COW16_12615 [Sphingomonadales bacterium CG12_big_fil_rev_8_21_14_0_65_65_10]|nr:MAG: hypothetical protein COW16_12615 [Sphingomonadales bacterium CG12_big_fil_rev_8_21_14_0_65_65_10]